MKHCEITLIRHNLSFGLFNVFKIDGLYLSNIPPEKLSDGAFRCTYRPMHPFSIKGLKKYDECEQFKNLFNEN